MSMHKKPLTPVEESGLRAHGLDIGTPSQLSDVFRQGVAWGAAREREACKGARAIEPEFVAYSADELIKIARQCHGIANRMLTSNKLLSVELCKDAYRVESIARSLVDALRARSNKGVDHG